MKIRPSAKIKFLIKKTLQSTIYIVANCANIDLLNLAYRQKGVGICDAGEREFLEYVLKRALSGAVNPVLLDVGANKGSYTDWLLEAIPHGCVHGFEPNPDTYAIYSERFKGDSRVFPHRLGLSNEAGKCLLYTYSSDVTSGHASFAQSLFETSNTIAHSVECRLETLNHLVESLPQLRTPSFIKIDIEGFEIKALQGAGKLLRSRSLVAIQFEFNSMNIHTRSFLKDFYDLLGVEFRFYRLTSYGMRPLGEYSPSNEQFIYQNIVSIRQDWSHLCLNRWPRRRKKS